MVLPRRPGLLDAVTWQTVQNLPHLNLRPVKENCTLVLTVSRHQVLASSIGKGWNEVSAFVSARLQRARESRGTPASCDIPPAGTPNRLEFVYPC